MKILPKYNSGQALLLVLLSMAVVLTIALSIISRSVTDISVTTSSEDSLRAFSAAEAGVEQAIIANQGGAGSFPGTDATFTSSVTDFYSGVTSFIYPFGELYSGGSGIIWFIAHDSDGNPQACNPPAPPCYTGKSFYVCWGEENTPPDSATTPAIEVSTLYLEGSTYKIHREASDPNTLRRGLNNFSKPDTAVSKCQIGGKAFEFRKTISLNPFANLQFARIRFLYNTESQPLGVWAIPESLTFPSQGVKIDSQGKAGSSNRRVEVIQGYAELPLPFAHVLFSEGGIVQ